MTNALSAVIIDNNKSSRKILLSVVRNGLGIKATNEFENAQHAIRYLKEKKEVDLIFIDHESVNGDTYKFVSSSKKLTGNTDLKFILLANTANKEFLLEAASKGISSFILKPYNSKTVVEKVRKVCSSKAQRTAQRLSLLEAVKVELLQHDEKIPGALIDISSNGCLLKTERLAQFGLDIYDILTLRIPFESEHVDLKAKLLRMERDGPEEERKISAAFAYQKMEEETALQFAKLWATLLKQSDKNK